MTLGVKGGRTDRRLAELRFAGGRLNAVMRRVYELYGQGWTDASYGRLAEIEGEVRTLVKADFKGLKERQVKDLLNPETWTAQKQLLDQAVALQRTIGGGQHDDFNEFQGTLKQALKAARSTSAAGSPPSPTPKRINHDAQIVYAPRRQSRRLGCGSFATLTQ